MPSADVSDVVEGLAGRESWPYAVVASWMRDELDLLPTLLAEAVSRLARSSTAVDAVVGLVDESVLAVEAEHALAVLGAGMDPCDSQAASLVAAISLQAPHLLAPYLQAIWDLGVNRRSYYASWPWRSATDPRERERLFTALQGEDEVAATRAAACLMQTRDPKVLRRVLQLDVPGPALWIHDPRSVGFAAVDEDVVALTPPAVYHVQFPQGCLRPYEWARTGIPLHHPTWALGTQTDRDAASARLGGTAEGQCPTCRGPAHRLLQLSPVPSGLGVTDCERLELITCLTCLGWVHPLMYTRHAIDGSAAQLVPGDERIAPPEFVAEPLPELGIRLVETPIRWRAQDWALSNDRENLNRFGGEPCWIQGADYPACPMCSRTMTFLAQLDTLDFAEHGEWMWGSGGIAYIFWCNACRYSSTTWQCT